MSEILEQLTLDHTFYYEFAIFAAVFVFLSRSFFKPFLAHLESRFERTVKDKETATQMMVSVTEKVKEYEASIQSARREAQALVQKIIQTAKLKESEILAQAREESRKRIQESLVSLNQEKSLIRAQVKTEVEQLANTLTERILAK